MTSRAFALIVRSLSVSSDGRLLLLGGGETNYRDESQTFGYWQIIDVESGETKARSEKLKKPLRAVALSRDERWIVYCDDAGPVSILEWQQAGAKPREFGGNDYRADQLTCLADGESLAAQHGGVWIWSMRELKTEHTVGAANGMLEMRSVVSVDGRLIAIATISQKTFYTLAPQYGLQIFAGMSRDPVADLRFGNAVWGGKAGISSIAFFPDGHELCVGFQDGVIRQWRIADLSDSRKKAGGESAGREKGRDSLNWLVSQRTSGRNRVGITNP